MSKGIIDKIESYLKNQEEQFGPVLFIDNIPDVNDDGSGDYKSTEEKSDKPKIISDKIEKNLSGEIHIKEDTTKKTGDKPLSFLNSPDNTVGTSWIDATNLNDLKENISVCLNCPLGHGRTNFVFGQGNPNADIMIIGEAPGADEDLKGLAFIGRAGQLLTKIIEAINLTREDVFIGNIIKCRPPGNRRPLPEETDQCEPYLLKQIEIIKPVFILALGLTAVDTLMKKKHKMAETRGKILNYHGTKMMVTYHPAALLRNPKWKKLVWEDVQKLRKMYDDYLEGKS